LFLVRQKESGAREKSNLVGLRDHLYEEVEPLAGQFTGECVDAGNVSARPVESGNQPDFHGIAAEHEDDRDGGRGGLSRKGGRRCTNRDNNGDLTADQISS
jgi:hypothetical protein